MKQLLHLYAKYNNDVNRKIEEIFNQLSIEELVTDRGGYFKSLLGTYRHLIAASRYLHGHWYRMFELSAFRSVEESKDIDLKTISFNDAKGLLLKFDTVFQEFVDSGAEFSSESKELRFRSGDGVMLSAEQTLLQFILHQTHHRGQISQMLDELSIEHDFGSIWDLLEKIE
jgi:uncharacterized damage-inducible protein DinB